MSTYYLSAQNTYDLRIFATGLYLYKKAADGNFDRYVINEKGTPILDERVSLTLNPASGITTVDDFIPVPDQPDTYLSLKFVEGGSTVKIGAFPLEQAAGLDEYWLPKQIHDVLYSVLESRHERSYGLMYDGRTFPIPWDELPEASSFSHNLSVFWQSIYLAAQNTVGAVTLSLRGTPDGPRFHNPDWAFQLIRTLTDGFVEGHAAYFQSYFEMNEAVLLARAIDKKKFPQSYKYRVIQQSIDSWKKVLTVLSQKDIELDILDRDPNLSLERQVLYTMIFPIQLSPFLFRAWVRLITPGDDDGKLLGFWLVHVPHWRYDLVQAVHEHNPRAPEAGGGPNKDDWDQLEAAIIKGFPEAQTGVWDWLVRSAVLAHLDILPDAAFNPRNFLIGHIFNQVRKWAEEV